MPGHLCRLTNAVFVLLRRRSGKRLICVDGAARFCYIQHEMVDVFGSYHSGLSQFVLSDGSVRSLSVNLHETTLGQLCNRIDKILMTELF